MNSERILNKALRYARRSSHQAFTVSGIYETTQNFGVIFIALQDGNGTYAIWNVSALAHRFDGFYTGNYQQAMEEYDRRFTKLNKRVAAAAAGN